MGYWHFANSPFKQHLSPKIAVIFAVLLGIATIWNAVDWWALSILLPSLLLVRVGASVGKRLYRKSMFQADPMSGLETRKQAYDIEYADVKSHGGTDWEAHSVAQSKSYYYGPVATDSPGNVEPADDRMAHEFLDAYVRERTEGSPIELATITAMNVSGYLGPFDRSGYPEELRDFTRKSRSRGSQLT